MKNYHLLIALLTMALLYSCKTSEDVSAAVGTLEVVAEIDINPGNLAVSKDGRIFTTIHPLRRGDLQLIEIVEDNKYVPFPNKEMQSTPDNISLKNFDAPLGLLFDNRNRLWMVDVGMTIGQARVFAYDIDTKKELYRFDIPVELAGEGSFVQDIVVDEDNDMLYVADAMGASIIVIDIKKNTFRKIVDKPSMGSEDKDMVIDGKVQYFFGDPIRIDIDPITISEDRETIYYGAMSSTNWYQIPTRVLGDSNASDEEIKKQISLAGVKPISDGAATDDKGNHYFTNVQNRSIDVLSKEGKLRVLKQDPKLDWPDSARIYGDWLYVSTNQIHKTAAFTGDKDLAEGPFRILKLKYR